MGFKDGNQESTVNVKVVIGKVERELLLTSTLKKALCRRYLGADAKCLSNLCLEILCTCVGSTTCVGRELKIFLFYFIKEIIFSLI